MKTKSIELELILKVQSFNDLKSYEALRNKYINLIKSEAAHMSLKFPNVPIEFNDLENVLTYHFYKTIIDYNPDKGMQFGVFAKQNLRFAIMNHVRRYISKNNIIMNYKEDYHDEHTYEDTKERDIAISTLEAITEELDNMRFLTDKEKKYLKIALNDNEISIKKIAEQLNIPVSTVYDLKNRTAKKLKTYLGL